MFIEQLALKIMRVPYIYFSSEAWPGRWDSDHAQGVLGTSPALSDPSLLYLPRLTSTLSRFTVIFDSCQTNKNGLLEWLFSFSGIDVNGSKRLSILQR